MNEYVNNLMNNLTEVVQVDMCRGGSASVAEYQYAYVCPDQVVVRLQAAVFRIRLPLFCPYLPVVSH